MTLSTKTEKIFLCAHTKMSLPMVSDVTSQTAAYASFGFFFAAAIAWMDVVRYVIARMVNVNRNGGAYYLLSAVFTSVLAIFLMMTLRRVGVLRNGARVTSD